MAVIGAGNVHVSSHKWYLRNYGLWWAELAKGWFWQGAEYRLRDGDQEVSLSVTCQGKYHREIVLKKEL